MKNHLVQDYWLLCLVVFFGMVIVDFAYAEYTKAASDRKKVASSSWASLLVVFNGIVVSSFVGDLTLLIPTAAGAWVGTYLSMMRSN